MAHFVKIMYSDNQDAIYVNADMIREFLFDSRHNKTIVFFANDTGKREFPGDQRDKILLGTQRKREPDGYYRHGL